MSGQRWYIGVLVVECSAADAAEEPLCELQYRLIHAADPNDAHSRALELGHAAEHTYKKVHGERVHWNFKGLRDLAESWTRASHTVPRSTAASWNDPRPSTSSRETSSQASYSPARTR